MANAGIDQNSRQTLTALSSTDGTTIVPLYADPTTHRLLVDSSGGSFTIVTTASTIDDSNTSFTFTATPSIVFINGLGYNAGATSGGVVMWTNVSNVVTTAYPVGSGGSIWGIA